MIKSVRKSVKPVSEVVMGENDIFLSLLFFFLKKERKKYKGMSIQFEKMLKQKKKQIRTFVIFKEDCHAT